MIEDIEEAKEKAHEDIHQPHEDIHQPHDFFMNDSLLGINLARFKQLCYRDRF